MYVEYMLAVVFLPSTLTASGPASGPANGPRMAHRSSCFRLIFAVELGPFMLSLIVAESFLGFGMSDFLVLVENFVKSGFLSPIESEN